MENKGAKHIDDGDLERGSLSRLLGHGVNLDGLAIIGLLEIW